MPVEIDLGIPPAGYAVTSAHASETVGVQFREFTSTEDGQHFIQRLEGFPDNILQKLPAPIPASKVDHMLALCRRDGSATVYLNELELQASVRASRPTEEGGSRNTRRLRRRRTARAWRGHSQRTWGALFVFSVGWRKGLFYDFRAGRWAVSAPTCGGTSPLSLGGVSATSSFRNDSGYRTLSGAICSRPGGFRSPRSAPRRSTSCSATCDPAGNRTTSSTISSSKSRAMFRECCRGWRNHSSLKPHLDIIERAVEGFRNDDDYIGCTGLLYPRIKEIRRTHLDATTGRRDTQQKTRSGSRRFQAPQRAESLSAAPLPTLPR